MKCHAKSCQSHFDNLSVGGSGVKSLLQKQPLHISQSLTQERLTWKKTLTDVPCKSPLPASCKKAIKEYTELISDLQTLPSLADSYSEIVLHM